MPASWLANRSHGAIPSAGSTGFTSSPSVTASLFPGSIVPLTRTELDVLAALADQPGRVWTREQIGQRVFSESFDTFDRTIDSHVKNLRAKLGPRPDGGPYVETVRGVGYRAARPVDPA